MKKNKENRIEQPKFTTQVIKAFSEINELIFQRVKLLLDRNEELELINSIYSTETIKDFMIVLFKQVPEFLSVGKIEIYINFDRIPREDSNGKTITETFFKYNENTNFTSGIYFGKNDINNDLILGEIDILEDGEKIGSITFVGNKISDNIISNFSKIKNTIEIKLKQIAKNKKLKKEAHTDFLTGIGNRRYIEEKIDKLLINNLDSTTIAYIQIDNFQQINDIYGREIGDTILFNIAQIINNDINDIGGYLGRNGGADFILIFKGYKEKEVSIILNKINNKLNSINIEIPERNSILNKITISTGVVNSGKNKISSRNELISTAYETSEKAVGLGGNRIEYK